MIFRIISQKTVQETKEKVIYACLNDEIPIGWLGKSVSIDKKNIQAEQLGEDALVLHTIGDFVGKEVVLYEEDFDHNAKRFYMP